MIAIFRERSLDFRLAAKPMPAAPPPAITTSNTSEPEFAEVMLSPPLCFIRSRSIK